MTPTAVMIMLMIFVCCLLTAWFVLWWIHSRYQKETDEIISFCLSEMVGLIDRVEEVDEEEDERLHKHRCKNCAHRWTSTEKDPNFCPNCGKSMDE